MIPYLLHWNTWGDFNYNVFVLAFVMIGVHALLDFPLQGQYLSDAKNNGPHPRYHCLMHCWIHAVGVFVVTGSLMVSMAELMVHYVTDRDKTKGHITYVRDQEIHILCKLVWAFIVSVMWIVAVKQGVTK